MNKKSQTATLAGVCVILMLLPACVPVSPGIAVTETPMPIVIGVSPTPTSEDSALIASSGDTTYTQGEIEAHTPDPVAGGEDCVSVIPFTIDWSTNPPTIQGGGRQDCHFQASGECALHMIMAYDVTLQGRFTTGDLGEERLLIDVTTDGSLKEYFVNCPADSVNPPWTEDDPWVITSADPLPTLNFEYLDGAKVILLVGEGTTTYFLHLME